MYEFYGIQAIEDIESHFQSFTITKNSAMSTSTIKFAEVQGAEGKCVYM